MRGAAHILLLLALVALTACDGNTVPEVTALPPTAIAAATETATTTATATRTPRPTATARASQTPRATAGPTSGAVEPTSTRTRTPAGRTATPRPTATRTRTPTPTATATLIPASVLARGLLQPADVPRNWRASDGSALAAIETADETTTLFLCHELPRRHRQSTEVAYSGGDLGPQLFHQIAVYPRGEAEAAFDSFVAAADACPEVRVAMGSGQTLRLQRTFSDFPRLGDETLALHLANPPIFLIGRPEIDLVKIRMGDVIITIGYFNTGRGVDSEVTLAYARRAVALWRAALP
jgi:hypothetical protein